jgi:alanyl-tRNA synthetase
MRMAPAAIERGQTELRELTRRLRALEQEAAGRRAADLLAQAEVIHDHRVVVTIVPGDAAVIKALAGALTAADRSRVVAVVVGDGHPAPVAIARTPDVALDAGAWMKAAALTLGGRGGGRPEQAQGGLSASADIILAHARETITELLHRT